MITAYVLAFCRMVILIVFAWSFWGKVRDRQSFEIAIARFRLLPDKFHSIATIVFLAAELAVVIMMLLGGELLLLGFGLATILLSVFSIALSLVLIRKFNMACNCFGPSKKPITSYDIIRNIGFIQFSLGGYGVLASMDNNSVALNWLEWGLAGMVAGTFVIVWVQMGNIVSLFRQV